MHNLFLNYTVENPKGGVSYILFQQISSCQHHHDDMIITEHCVLNIAIWQIFSWCIIALFTSTWYRFSPSILRWILRLAGWDCRISSISILQYPLSVQFDVCIIRLHASKNLLLFQSWFVVTSDVCGIMAGWRCRRGVMTARTTARTGQRTTAWTTARSKVRTTRTGWLSSRFLNTARPGGGLVSLWCRAL